MKQKSKDQIKQQSDGNVLHAHDQGGHEGLAGHGGQHSGGMGGEHGGDLHDVGSAQSGMTGRGGMGGNEAGLTGAARQGQQSDIETNPDDDLIGIDEPAEVQQSAQRAGMGNHRQSTRGNEQAIDGASDVDDLGSHNSAAGKSRG